jgi:hypothetical protein
MVHSRKPTEKETNEIIADMVRLYQLDENLMPDMCDREDIVGNENHTDEEEAKYWLSKARVIIADMNEKAGVIFWGGESGGFLSVLKEDSEGKFYIESGEYVTMYWGA